MHSTRHDLAKDSRRKVIGILEPRLADAIDLALAMKQAHWAVKGPGFSQLHELFDTIAGEAAEHADELAERVVQLGGQPRGTVQAVARETTLRAYPAEISAQQQHLEAVADRLAGFAKSIRHDIERAASVPDAGTADLLTQISRAVDKALWMVESHLPAKG